MAISFQAQASGQKTTTSGTSATIALSSTAGDMVVVGIAQSSATITVSSVTDGGGNTYHQVMRTTSGTAGVDIWCTDKVAGTAASGTITVTLSASGARVSACATSYRNVAFVNDKNLTANNTSTTMSTGALTLTETNSWIVSAGGNGNAAWTQQNGILRVQATGTTGVRGCIIDSNDNASQITNSATMTSGAWIIVSLELMPLEATQDNNGANWSDAAATGVGGAFAFTDVLELADAGITAGFQDIDYNGFAHWREGFRMERTQTGGNPTQQFMPLADGNQRAVVTAVPAGLGAPSVTLSNTLVWQDGTPQEIVDLTLNITCLEMGANWADSDTVVFGLNERISQTLVMDDFARANLSAEAQFADQMTMSDSETAVMDLLFKINQTLSMDDFVKATFSAEFQLSDQLVLSDSLLVGYGLLVSDTETLTDAFAFNLTTNTLELDVTASDQLVLSDFLALGYGNLVSDQLVLSDALVVWFGFNEALSDQLVMSDALAAGYGAATSDQLVFVDSLSEGYGAGLSDNLNNWADFVAAGYGAVTSDQLVIADSVSSGYGARTSDQMTFSDSELNVLGMNEALSDQDTTWLDALAAQMSIAATLSDQMTMSDSLLAGYGAANSDQLVFVESLGTGYGAGLSDTVQLNDALTIGYGNRVSDQLVLSDSDVIVLGFVELLADDLNNWADTVPAFIGEFDIAVAETLSFSDALAAGYGLLISDNEGTNWSEQFTFNSGGGQSFGFTDQMTMSDFLGAGYGAANSDQVVMVESVGAGYGAVLSDQDTTWLDARMATLGMNEALSDQDTTWLDAVKGQLNMLTTFADTLTMSDFTGAGYGAANSDQIIIADSISSGYGGVLSDQLTFSDTEANVLGQNKAASDTLTMADFAAAGYGFATSDQLVVSDSTGAGYGFILSDNLNNWLDAFIESLPSSVLQELLADTLTMSDFVAAGYGAANSDQMVLVESVGAGYGGVFRDQLVMSEAESAVLSFEERYVDTMTFTDSESALMAGALGLADTLAFNDALGAGYGYGVTEQMGLVDRLGAGYGAQVSDQMGGNWADAVVEVVEGGVVGLDLVLTDAAAAFWTDHIDELMAGLVGPMLVYKVKTKPSVIFDGISATMAMELYKVQARPDVMLDLSGVRGQTIGTIQMSFGESINNWSDAIPQSWKTVQVADALTGWLDDTSLIVESTGGDFSFALDDQIIFADGVVLQSGALGRGVTDSLSNWADGVRGQLQKRLALSNSINFWADGVVVMVPTIPLVLSDSMNNWVDLVPGFIWEWDIAVGEQLSMDDQLIGHIS